VICEWSPRARRRVGDGRPPRLCGGGSGNGGGAHSGVAGWLLDEQRRERATESATAPSLTPECRAVPRRAAQRDGMSIRARRIGAPRARSLSRFANYGIRARGEVEGRGPSATSTAPSERRTLKAAAAGAAW